MKVKTKVRGGLLPYADDPGTGGGGGGGRGCG